MTAMYQSCVLAQERVCNTFANPLADRQMAPIFPAMSDLSDRFSETLPCGCTSHAGSWDPCAAHRTPHSQHTQPVLGCDRCDDLLNEAREVAQELGDP